MDYGRIEQGSVDENTHWLLLGHKKSRGNSVGLVIQPIPSGEFICIGQMKVPKKSGLWHLPNGKRRVVTIV
jgi:hypothetical protein